MDFADFKVTRSPCISNCQVPTSVIITLAYNVPRFFELRIERGDIVTTEMRNSALYSSLYVFWSKLVLFEVIPYCTIMLCNILIVAKVQKASRWASLCYRHRVEHKHG